MKKILIALILGAFAFGGIIYFLNKKKIIDPRETVRFAGFMKKHWYNILIP
jgi:hypothetical protein